METTAAGEYHKLIIDRITEPGAYLRAHPEDILLPIRFVPDVAAVGDEMEVFVYHDSESRLIATTQKPFGVVGDVIYVKAVEVGRQGAFMDWGLMKDLFVPLSQQRDKMMAGQYYFVKIYRDEQTGRVAATQKYVYELSNEHLTIGLGDTVRLLIHRETEIGYEVLINSQHIGLLHFEDAYLPVTLGKKLKGTVSKIREGNKIDVRLGERGYQKVSGEAERILHELKRHNGYLPYYDKSAPEDIYRVFGMSKKTFKMAVGQLLKQGKIELTTAGIKRVEV